ncbi:hypothetical protein [Longirhabdus pacifica]|uniref:hypothetical protein n=1 Tax=Longirhabdus pacifica TaxID=2305227 RepID=UPI0013E8A143|nr:hypothetical protein [Longirhabdus pacifica]
MERTGTEQVLILLNGDQYSRQCQLEEKFNQENELLHNEINHLKNLVQQLIKPSSS